MLGELGELGALLRCATCGHKIAVELGALGARLATVVLFFDDEPGSDTRGGRVSECPGCATRLGLHTLAPLSR